MASDSSISSSTVNSLPLTTTSLTLVNFPSSLKLSSANYLSWKTQIEALLHVLDLYKFINGTHLPPKPTATNGVSTPHADYPAWFRQDRLLFGALVGTLSPVLVPLVSSAATSLEAWTILSNTYAKPSRGHIKQLQHRLKQTSKTSDKSVTEYMQSIKAIVDELSILGKPMDQEDVTDAILTGLDSKSYKSVIESIHARDTPIPFTELHEKLKNHELSLIQNQPIPTSIHHPSTAFVAHKNYPSKPWNNRNTSNQNPILPTPPQYPTNNNTTARPFLGKCQFCFSKGHSLIQCYAFKNNGASHHITSDLSNLSLHNAYNGTDELDIGDVLSIDEYKYYIIFVDHFTKYTWLYPLKHKSDSLNTFIRFQKLVENFFQLKIKQLFSDNGGEYVKMSSHLSSCGISHLTSPPHTPEHNGYAERRHRHIVETALSLLSHAHMPLKFWTYAVTTATYLINRLPTKTLNNKSPYFCLFQKQPNYDKLRSFGCLAYPWLRPYTKHKLESRSKPCIFVSYSSSQSAYHLLDPLANKIHTSRHVYFVESEFPYNSLTNTTPTNTPAPDSWLQLSLIPLPNPSTNIPPEIPSPSPQNTIPPSSTTIPPNSNPNTSHNTPVSAPSNTTTSAPPPDIPPKITRNNPKPNPKYHNVDFLLYM
ncbi:hypothetical protein LXL04_039780 [Taraxacum kok-saghyz]